VADDPETAKKVAFNDLKGFICVTLKGDKYNFQGTLEGGYQKSAGIFNMIERYKSCLDKNHQLIDAKSKIDRERDDLSDSGKSSNCFTIVQPNNVRASKTSWNCRGTSKKSRTRRRTTGKGRVRMWTQSGSNKWRCTWRN